MVFMETNMEASTASFGQDAESPNKIPTESSDCYDPQLVQRSLEHGSEMTLSLTHELDLHR